jgi:P pilus assembly chaperone PapD
MRAITLAAVLALLASPAAAQSIMVAPTKLELGVGRNAVGEVRVINTTDTDRPVRVTIQDPSKADKAVANAGSAEWARWAPKKFTLPASGGQTVRVLVGTPEGTKPGTYRVRLHIKDLEGGKRREITSTGNGGSFGVRLKMNVSLPVVIDVPER